MAGRFPGNPADRPGVKVYRPKKIEAIEYDPNKGIVRDTSNGDFLHTTSGHAGGVGQWTFGNRKVGMIAYGGYYSWGGGPTGPTVFDVRSLRRELVENAPHLARSEFDLTRIAELFRAKKDAASPHHRNQVLVVDSRPAKPGETNDIQR